MKKLIASALLLGAGIAMTPVSGQVQAAPLDFRFAFQGTAHGEGLVTGFIRGLRDDAVSKATSIEVVASEGGFGVGTYAIAPGDPEHRFTVVSGVLKQGFFFSFGTAAASPDVTCCSFGLDFNALLVAADPFDPGPYFAAGLSNSPNFVAIPPVGTISFTAVPAPAVPLPAAAVLVLTGAGCLGALRMRRQRRGPV